MIRVSIVLHGARSGKIRLLNTIRIANDGTGTRTRGHYEVRVGTRQETARVVDFPRKSRDVVELLRRALNAEHSTRTARRRALTRKGTA